MEVCTKHQIYVGKREGNEVLEQLEVGQAYLREGENYYTVKLMIFPGQTYFLVKNRDSHDRYTMYAKVVRNEGQVKFQNPVGSGRLYPELTEYLQLYVPLFRTRMFMSLYPAAE